MPLWGLSLIACANAILSREDPSGKAPELFDLEPVEWSRHLGGASCELPARSGRRNGVCLDEVALVQSQLTFCKDVVQYRACIPAHQPLWPDWNATKKDAMLARLFKGVVEKRLAKELNVTPKEFVEIHLLSNKECFTALRNALCWFNFPKCDEGNASLPLCRQSCEDFYSACKYEASGDGLYDPCREYRVSTDGLFMSNAPGILGEDLWNRALGFALKCTSIESLFIIFGRAGIYGEDNVTCENAAGGGLGEQDNLRGDIWLLTPPGLAVSAVVLLLLLTLAYFLLVPYGLRAYISWSLRQLILVPLSLFRRLPPLKGLSCIAIIAVIFLVAVVFGIYWTDRAD
eukprot:symbB.v1.2.013851.t1/scaffold989.1/size146301/1